MGQILAGSNWKLQEAGSGAQALACLENHSAPLILCERELPDGDWKGLLEKVQALSKPLHVIVTSRNADNLLWAEVLNCGGYDVLPLRFERAEVLRVLRLAWPGRRRAEAPRHSLAAAV